MAEAFAHDLDRDPLFQQRRGVRTPEIVKPARSRTSATSTLGGAARERQRRGPPSTPRAIRRRVPGGRGPGRAFRRARASPTRDRRKGGRYRPAAPRPASQYLAGRRLLLHQGVALAGALLGIDRGHVPACHAASAAPNTWGRRTQPRGICRVHGLSENWTVSYPRRQANKNVGRTVVGRCREHREFLCICPSPGPPAITTSVTTTQRTSTLSAGPRGPAIQFRSTPQTDDDSMDGGPRPSNPKVHAKVHTVALR